jgi:hypothetical protein
VRDKDYGNGFTKKGLYFKGGQSFFAACCARFDW